MLRRFCAGAAPARVAVSSMRRDWIGGRGGAGWVGARERGGGRRWFSEGALSEEDEHEIMFFSLRHAATVTLKEMHQFGSQVQRRPPFFA
eukprot:3430629-Rhodomonas_salina.2